ncbi:uncharacterized protein C2orf81 homolog isoform 1-T2 [Odontesthes bonariensis]|uniref:uncharacterized protein C2orf81 homolog n=1 Tax=Odontesthes bonariensis TaxID=219752 RepID=UPI003F58DB8B
MPRSAPKSKADKHRPKPSVKETTPQRVNQAMWTNMLIQEDADEVVGEIMDELISKVMDGCYKVHMERQLAPFTASWAKSYITEVLEHQFLSLDAEGPEEAFRAEDSEPMPALPDSWAQGCVPVVHAHTHRPHHTKQQEVDTDHAPVHIKQSVQKQSNVKDSLQNQAEKETSPRKSVSDTYYNVLSSCPPPKTNRQRKQHVTIPPKIVPSKLLPSLSCSTAKQNVEVEGKTMEQKTASRHQHKGCKPIPKLDPLSLPRHWIVSQYEIMDDDTKPNPQKLNRNQTSSKKH